MNDKVLTIWADGTWKIWRAMDAYYARTDPNWLTEIPVKEIIDEANLS